MSTHLDDAVAHVRSTRAADELAGLRAALEDTTRDVDRLRQALTDYLTAAARYHVSPHDQAVHAKYVAAKRTTEDTLHETDPARLLCRDRSEPDATGTQTPPTHRRTTG